MLYTSLFSIPEVETEAHSKLVGLWCARIFYKNGVLRVVEGGVSVRVRVGR
jgi:hypothetical protein